MVQKPRQETLSRALDCPNSCTRAVAVLICLIALLRSLNRNRVLHIVSGYNVVTRILGSPTRPARCMAKFQIVLHQSLFPGIFVRCKCS